MSDDLISRKAVKSNIEAIRECWAISPYVSADDIRLYSKVFNVISRCISDCPTAFDKEKVMEELRQEAMRELGIPEERFNLDEGEYFSYCSISFSQAKRIVEKGGIK